MSIQGQLNQFALEMTPLTLEYIREIAETNPSRAGHHRYVVVQAALKTYPCLDKKTDEQLHEYDMDMRNSLYRMDNDSRFDEDLYTRDCR